MDYDVLTIQAWIFKQYETQRGIDPNRNLWIEPYAYPLTFLALAPGGVQTQNLTINANADFFLTRFSHRANVALAAQTTGTKTAPFIRALLVDAGSSIQFTNAAVDLENFSTNANPQRHLAYPRWLAANTALTVQMTNYSGTETYNLDFSLEGLRVREFSSPVGR